MLDFTWSEILIIGAVALVVVPPKDLPVVLRTAGRWANRARGMAREFRGQIDQAIREAELDELRKSVHDEVGKLNPLTDLEQSFHQSLEVHPHPTPETKEPTPAPAPTSAPKEEAEPKP